MAGEPSDPLLVVHNLSAGYLPGEPIVRGIGFTVAPSEVVGVLGPNGAGKSTLLKALAGTCRYEAGEAWICGAPLLGLPANRRVRLGLGFVPRELATFPNLSVGENLAMGAFALNKAAAEAQLAEVLDLMPQIKPLLRRRVLELSGGQAEMVAIALGLMSEPKVLMIDEPSAGLAVGAVSSLIEALAKLVALRSLPMLLVEQNLGVAEQLCTRFLILESGGHLVGEATTFPEAIELLEAAIHGPAPGAAAQNSGSGHPVAFGR